MEEQVGKTILQDALRVLEMEVMDLVAVKKDIEFYMGALVSVHMKE